MAGKLFVMLVSFGLLGGSALALWWAAPGPGPTATPEVWVSGTGDCGVWNGTSPCVDTIEQGVRMVDAGGTVHVLPFDTGYPANERIDKPLTLHGEDRDGVVIFTPINDTIFFVTSGGVTIENMTLKPGPTAFIDTVGVWATKSSGVRIRDLTIVDMETGIVATGMQDLMIASSDVLRSTTDGIQVADSQDVLITARNRVLNSSFLGLAVDSSNNVTITGNTFAGNGVAGFNISFSVNVTVRGNVITDNGFSQPIPIIPGPAPRPWCCSGGGGWFWQTDPTAVESNVVTGNGEVGILIGGDRSTDFTLFDNLIAGNSGHGLLLAAGASRIDVRSIISGNDGDGIAMDNVSAVVIHDSQLESNGRFGVAGQFAQDLHILDNVIAGNGQPSPISTRSSGPRPLCCTGGGGWFWQTDPSEFRGNTVVGNDGAGVALIDSTDWDISDNTFTSTAGPGTDLVRAQNVRVTNNAYADLAVGIRIEDGCHIFLEGNTFTNVDTPLQVQGTPCDVQLGGLATLRFMPRTLNLKSQGQFATVRFEVTGIDPSQFDVSTLVFDVNGVDLTVPAGSPSSVMVHGDVIDAMVKLDRAEVIEALGAAGTYTITLKGEIMPGVFWVASDTITAILP